MHVRRQERQRRRRAHDDPHRQIIRSFRGEISIEAQHIFRGIERMDDQSSEHFRADRMEMKIKRRHDAEIPAAAANRPKQIGVIIRVAMELCTNGRDDIRRD